MNSNPNHNDLEESIHQYLEGSLTSEETDELWKQLIRYPEYLDYLKTTANLKSIAEETEEVEGEQFHTATTGTARSYILAIAAVVLATILTGLFYWSITSTQEQPELAERIELNVMRSVDAPAENPEEQRLNHAIQLAAAGEHQQAGAILDSLKHEAQTHDVRANAALNAGVIAYNEGDYQEAATVFEDLMENFEVTGLRKEKALWYRAQALAQLGRYEEAGKLAGEVMELNGNYYRAAEQLRSHLP